MNNEWVLIDTETTGFGNPVYPLELAAQRMNGWTIIGPPFRRLINQNVKVPPEASRVNGYTREILERDGDLPSDVYRDFDTYAGQLPIGAYNLAYDLDQVLSPDWDRTGIKSIGSRGFCVLELTQRLLDPSPAGNCKLQTLRQFYRLPERGAHTALGDVMTVADLLENVLQPIAESKGLRSWDDVHRFISDPWYPRRIRIGKFKGMDFLEASANRDLRNWLEWLAESSNERSANMGRWYLQQLDSYSDQDAESHVFVATQSSLDSAEATASGTTIVVYYNPDLDVLRRSIAVVRDRLAEVEAKYTRDRNAVNVIQAQLFSLLRPHYQKRDRLKNTVFYRRTFLDAILRGEEEDASVQVEASAQANEEVDSEYERASQSAESKKALTESEEKELEKTYRKLVNLYHPDRFATDPEKAASYQKLTTAINQARDDGDIETLREIAKDANGFMARNNFGTLDFSDEVQIGKLRKLLVSLEAELLNVMELRNDLLESAEYELYRLSSKNPQVVQAAANEHSAAIESEIAELTQEAARLEQEIEELTGAASGVE
jgi:DNA polymerase III epsilon subunit-like protein